MHPGRPRIRGSSLKTGWWSCGGRASVGFDAGCRSANTRGMETRAAQVECVRQCVWSWCGAAGVAGANGHVCLPLEWTERQGHGTRDVCTHRRQAQGEILCADRAGPVQGGRIVSKPPAWKSYVLIVRGQGRVQAGAGVKWCRVRPNTMVPFWSGWKLPNCARAHGGEACSCVHQSAVTSRPMATAILGEVLPDARPTRLLPSESWVQVGEQAGPSTASIIARCLPR